MAFSASSPDCCNDRSGTVEALRPDRSLTRAAVYALLCFAILLFLLQTLPYLSYRWVTDESWYTGPAYSIAHGDGFKDPAIGPNDLENHFDARPPGTAIVIAAGLRLFGTGQIPARMGSILAGLAIVVLTYRLGRDVIGEKGALISTFLVATDNLIVLTSRTARPEALTTMAILASLRNAQGRFFSLSPGWAIPTAAARAAVYTLMILAIIVFDSEAKAFVYFQF